MVGSVAGPALGPCIAGIIVTFSSWRSIYWLQLAMSGFGFALSLIVLPDIRRETIVPAMDEHPKRDRPTETKVRVLLRKLNPWRVLKLLRRPNILLAVRIKVTKK